MTTSQVNEIQLLKCVGTSGYFRLTYKGQTTGSIAYNANMAELKAALELLWTIDEVTVTYVESDSEICTAGGQIAQIEFTQNFGNLQSITVQETNGPDSVAIADDSSGVTSFDTTDSVAGTKEDKYCSQRGTCDTSSGVCTCSENFATSNGLNVAGTRGDCGFKSAAVVGCPGVISCSGHGVCSNHAEYTCACSTGWTGADCSERVCPEGRAWFDEPTADNDAHNNVECSNMGTCDRTLGQCSCHTGFEGSACERLSCPAPLGVQCSGHGNCLSMAQLAEAYTDNGVTTAFTYGADPNDALRWDYASIYGCNCDLGYEGYDCSLRSCPTGDDPKTDGVTELQVHSTFDSNTLHLTSTL